MFAAQGSFKDSTCVFFAALSNASQTYVARNTGVLFIAEFMQAHKSSRYNKHSVDRVNKRFVMIMELVRSR